MDIPELAAPAGDLEKLETALRFGADAVYFSGANFGLRAHAGNLSLQEISQASQFCRERGKRIYAAVNIFAGDSDIDELPTYIAHLDEIGVDAVIVSDPGVLTLVRETAPGLDIHLSTQANTMNCKSVDFWRRNGVNRVILARELGYTDIERIASTPGIELEVFVHGAMCLSYSGRCYISDFLTGRSANRGECAHPCRWRYSLVEDKRPGEYFTVEEDARGAYFMNSKDLCLIDHLEKLARIGISAVKIEGRMKGVLYAASVTRTYRAALDSLADGAEDYHVLPEWRRELELVSHREYSSGFFNGKPAGSATRTDNSSYIKNTEFLGRILAVDAPFAQLGVRNGFDKGERVEVIRPKLEEDFTQVIEDMRNEEGEPVERANPNARLRICFQRKVEEGDLLRKHL